MSTHKNVFFHLCTLSFSKRSSTFRAINQRFSLFIGVPKNRTKNQKLSQKTAEELATVEKIRFYLRRAEQTKLYSNERTSVLL